MDENDVRRAATATCEAIVAGDMDRVIADLSPELQRNVGEVITLFPLPATEASVVSVDRGGSAFVVGINVVGETDEVELQTRWKDRDGSPTIVEASHLSRTAREPVAAELGEPVNGSAEGGA